MKAFLETTVWTGHKYQPNHVYWMDDGKNRAYAYARWGNPGDTQTFKKPLPMDTRGRRFVEVRHDIYGWTDAETVPETANPTWTITGSKGDKYIVEKDGAVYNCTCPGFKFRGECRHIKEVESNA